MYRSSIVLIGVAILAIATTGAQTNRPRSLDGLTIEEQADFVAGFALFEHIWTTEDGLGPLFNGQSCGACHHHPSTGGSGTHPDAFVANTATSADATNAEIFQQFLTRPGRSIVRRLLPSRHAIRRPTALFGLGLLEAVPEAQLANNRTRPTWLSRAVPGRFGWKNKARNINEFVASALTNEMGITNSLVPVPLPTVGHLSGKEATNEQIRLIAQFVRLLAPPKLRHTALLEHPGYHVFNGVGCADCHQATMITGESSVFALRHRTIHAFTDLLLHDMGPQSAEPFTDGAAGASEFRTAPLWGLSQSGPPYLHDGRANSIAEAILGHGGEAETSVRKYKLLSLPEQRALLQFLRSL